MNDSIKEAVRAAQAQLQAQDTDGALRTLQQAARQQGHDLRPTAAAPLYQHGAIAAPQTTTIYRCDHCGACLALGLHPVPVPPRQKHWVLPHAAVYSCAMTGQTGDAKEVDNVTRALVNGHHIGHGHTRDLTKEEYYDVRVPHRREFRTF